MQQPVWVEPDYVTTSRFTPEFYAFKYLALEKNLNQTGQEYMLEYLGSLGKLFAGPFGSELPTSKFVEQGIPLLRVQNVGELEILTDNLAQIGWDTHQEIIRSKLISGDLAIAKAGRIGTTAIIPPSISECNITQHIVGLQVNRNKVDSHYLAAFLISKYGQFQFERQGVGTLIRYLGVEDTRQGKVILPPRPVQEYIGAKVRLAERCRTRARELLDEAKERLSQLAHSEDFFPSSKQTGFVTGSQVTDRLAAEFYLPAYLDLERHVNETGSPVAPMVELLRSPIIRTGTPNRVEFKAIPCILTSDIDPQRVGHSSPSLWISKTVCSKHRGKLQPFDVVYTSVGPPVGEAALILPEYLPMAVGGDVSVLRAGKDVNPGYLCLYLNSIFGRMQNDRYARGIRQRRVYPEDVGSFLAPVPQKGDQDYIGERVVAYERLNDQAANLVRNANADVEALIEGRLDVDGIVAGRVQPPAWEEVAPA